MIDSIDDLQSKLAEQEYLADRALATTIYLGLKLNKPILLEGEAGVGKTEVAKALSALLETELIRLQCYEGLDINAAAYEWNVARQLADGALVQLLPEWAATPSAFDGAAWLLYPSRAFLPDMLERHSGQIVNVTSRLATRCISIRRWCWDLSDRKVCSIAGRSRLSAPGG